MDQLEEGWPDDRRRGAPATRAARPAPIIVRPYRDTTGDGMVQLSFTLPIPPDAWAEGAALQLAARLGTDPAMVVHAKGLGPAASAADVMPERVVVVRTGGTVVPLTG